ncbi:MAG TPA: hypothetical protein VM735_10145 [Candidatus Kapabacteria bacterium]|nr:hypothetical protein [Candidatus Kapabacteria bacterium]
MPLLIGLWVLLVGCATPSTIETRRAEKLTAYNSLAPEERQLVDQGQIKMGMSSDAVYIAWGPPSEVLESEDPQQGRISTWRYYGSWMQESRYWAYRETTRGGADLYLERYLVSDYQPRDYVRAEINFKQGRALSWRTLPRPAY